MNERERSKYTYSNKKKDRCYYLEGEELKMRLTRLRPIVTLICITPSKAWVPPEPRVLRRETTRQHFGHSLLVVKQLHQSESSAAEGDDEKFHKNTQQQRQKEDLERQRQDAQETLEQISALKNVILIETPFSTFTTTKNNNSAVVGSSSLLSLEDCQRQVESLEQKVAKLESELVPPKGLSMDEYKDAMALFLQTPFPIRWAFCEALELENPAKAATNLQRIPEIVALLYQQRIQLTPKRLQDALKQVQTRMTKSAVPVRITVLDGKVSKPPKSDELKQSGLASILFQDKTQEELQLENTVRNVLGRVTRKEGIEATQKDLDRMLKVLDKETFVVSGTDQIPGGFVIRGKNVKKSGSELIRAIDAKLPGDYPAQVSLMADVTNPDIVGEQADPVLVLLNKDVSRRVSGVLTSLCSTFAILSAFVYCVSVYGSNDLVASRLSEATAVSDPDGVSWFTNKVYDVMLPLFAIQLLHEIGHFAVAKSKSMDTEAPTLLPFWGLPFMGAKTELITSPPNRNALFDFAIVGPLLGLLASLGSFAFGLQLTASADASTVQFYPSLPVSLLQTSNFGGTMVDFFLGGGPVGAENRFITMQDPSTPVPLHPLAIAGFVSLLMNALALLPLGSTDGGRMSMAIFGRFGHTIVGATVWLTLLIASFGLERADILIGAWIVNNIVENDMEIPCRDETEEVSIPRVLAALSLWFLTILAITPLSQ